MSFKSDTGKTRKKRVVSDTSGLPSVLNRQDFTRRTLSSRPSSNCSPISSSSSSPTIMERLIQERKDSAAAAARKARDYEIVMKSDEWKRAKERAEEAFNERRRTAFKSSSSSSSSSAPLPKKIKKGYVYEEIPVEAPEIETSRSIRSRDRKKRIEDAEMEAAIKAVEDQEVADSLLGLSRGNRGGKRNTRRVKKSKKVNKRSNKKKYMKTHRKSHKSRKSRK